MSTMTMKALLVLILMSEVYAKSLMPRPDLMLASEDLTEDGSLLAVTPQRHPQSITAEDDDDYKNEILHRKIFAELQRYYLNKLQNRRAIADLEDSEIQKTAYLLIKTMKQRDKRYTSYLTLCHFKICNMGRKRTTRYFQMIKSLHDDHT